MKPLRALLTSTFALAVIALASQLSAAAVNDAEARVVFQHQLSRAGHLLETGEWNSLASEAQRLMVTADTLESRPGISLADHNTARLAMKQHAAKLSAAARGENRAEATMHFRELAASFQATEPTAARVASHTSTNLSLRVLSHASTNSSPRAANTLTPFDQGSTERDLATTTQIRKDVVAQTAISMNARNVKIITRDGRVTLRGTVDSMEEKRLLGRIATRVARPNKVDNLLKVVLTTSSND